MSSTPPVLLLLFNRPDLTQQLVSILRSVRPPKVFVAIDGPRVDKPEDAQKIQDVLQIARSIDWTPEVKFLIREKNLGCGKAPSSAIDWFFDHEEQGIILEDDIHPSADFFPFCNEMLTRYVEDNRVAAIIGHSFVPSSLRHPAGYFFTKFFQGWGWATWRRFWKTYDFSLTSLTDTEWEKVIIDHSEESLERLYWLIGFNAIKSGKWTSVWDYQAQFCIWRNKQVNIMAGNNLISNEGFREDATHSTTSDHACRKTIPLVGPFPEQLVKPDVELDRRNFMWQYIMNVSYLINLVRILDSYELKPQLVQKTQEITNLKQDKGT